MAHWAHADQHLLPFDFYEATDAEAFEPIARLHHSADEVSYEDLFLEVPLIPDCDSR